MNAEDKCEQNLDICARRNAEDKTKRRKIHANNVSAAHNANAVDTKRKRDAKECPHERKIRRSSAEKAPHGRKPSARRR